MLILTPTIARQLAVSAQRLGEPLPTASKARMFDILKSIRCLQLDPIRAVERTQYLVLWSRLGQYEREWLRELTYRDKALFEFWAHAASIVLSEDYPIHQRLMQTYATNPEKRLYQWIAKNENFKRYVLGRAGSARAAPHRGAGRLCRRTVGVKRMDQRPQFAVHARLSLDQRDDRGGRSGRPQTMVGFNGTALSRS